MTMDRQVDMDFGVELLTKLHSKRLINLATQQNIRSKTNSEWLFLHFFTDFRNEGHLILTLSQSIDTSTNRFLDRG